MNLRNRPITERQRSVLAFLRSFYRANDQLPPVHVVAAHFGWASWNAAQQHLDALRRHGYLERNAVGKWRFSRAQIPERESEGHSSSDER